MRQQLVNAWMSKHPITIEQTLTITEAGHVMDEHNIRRLPVTDEAGRLVGIITRDDLRNALPGSNTSLDILQLGYLLTQITIDRFMTTDPHTVTPDTTIPDAARLMMEYKIGALPVLEDGEIVGIITESDIFRMVVQTQDKEV